MSIGTFAGAVTPGAVMSGTGRADFGQGSASALAMKWSALNDAGEVVAGLAGLAIEARPAEVRNFPVAVRGCLGWRKALAEQGIDDLSAVLEPGIAALLAIQARGSNPRTAAVALWQDFARPRRVARAGACAGTWKPPSGLSARFPGLQGSLSVPVRGNDRTGDDDSDNTRRTRRAGGGAGNLPPVRPQ